MKEVKKLIVLLVLILSWSFFLIVGKYIKYI